MNYNDGQGIEHNFVYILNMTLTPQNYGLIVPPYLCENKGTITKMGLNIKLNENYIRYIVRETQKQFLHS